MDDHIVEKIFGYLDFVTKKSFSECCTRFNQIFNRRKHLDNVWCDIEAYSHSDTSRSYSNFIWKSSRPQISEILWTKLSSSMTALEIHMYMREEDFYDALPFFVNLKHLKVNVSDFFLEYKLPYWDRKHRHYDELVEMKNLEHLEMCIDIFTYLKGRYINFAPTKLGTLILGYESKSYNFSSNQFKKIRDLISNQTKLRKLHLVGANSLFDEPINLQCQLEDLRISTKGHKSFKSTLEVHQQENLFDFVSSQGHLKCLYGDDITIKKNDVTEKMDKFIKQRLNFPSKSKCLIFPQILLDSDRYSYNEFSVEDLIQCSSVLNLSTEEFFIQTMHSEGVFRVLELIVSKFPNLTTIKFSNMCDREQSDSLAALSELQNLKDLRLLDQGACELISSVTVPSLECFHCLFYDHFNAADIIEFLGRHAKIQELHTTTYRRVNSKVENSINCIVEFAIENLKHFKFFSIDDKYYHGWNQSFLLSVINTRAKPLFVFKTSISEMMKRQDNEIVRKVKGRWEVLDMSP